MTARRALSRTLATAMISRMKPGTIAIVPPTLAPNPGQPEAITANSATADTTSTARPRGPPHPPEAAHPFAAVRQLMPGDRLASADRLAPSDRLASADSLVSAGRLAPDRRPADLSTIAASQALHSMPAAP